MSARRSLALALLLIAGAPASYVEASAHQAYALTYMDVLPESLPQVRDLLVRYQHLILGAKGHLGAAALQEIGRPDRIALLEVWDSEDNWQAQHATPGMLSLADQLGAFSAGYEDRRLFEARSAADGASMDFDAPVQSIAHLDLALPMPAETEQFLNDLAARLRALPGNLGAAVLRQANRGNHLTLWVQWQDESAWRASLGTPLIHKLRSILGPQLGSPFDERIYQSLH